MGSAFNWRGEAIPDGTDDRHPSPGLPQHREERLGHRDLADHVDLQLPPQGLQLQCPGLQPKWFGADAVVVRGVHASHGHAAALQFCGGRQTDRPCADDHDVDVWTVHDMSGKAGNT